MRISTAASALVFGSLCVSACSSSDSGPSGAGGQSAGTGGKSTSSGGSSGSGGSTGGAQGTGGTQSGSGGKGSGGADPGGSGGKGGATGPGTSGGAPGSGGKGSGGATASGGASGSAGAPGSGGTTTSRDAGSPDSATQPGKDAGSPGGTGGGTTGQGGATGSSGGSTGGGGTVVSACGLPAGPNSGVAAPSGSGTKLDVLPWAGFKAATSFSLDDGNQSQIDNYKTLNGMGVPLTFYLVTGWSSTSNAIWKQAILDGHEIGNHTQGHSCGTASSGQSDIKSKFGVTAYTLAAPNGDTSCGSSVSSLNLLLNRGVNGGSVSFTAAESVAQNLPTSLPASGASASALTGTIDGAYAKGEWQTFCIHGFTGDGSAYQPIPLASLTDAVKTEKAKKDLWIDTMQAVGGYWRAGLVFAKATATTSGTDKTWKWTVPASIPPNTCLRVKSDGGVVKQKGTTVPWDDHGYYEISFNAGEVTLSAE